MKTKKFSNGQEIPAIGFGTWEIGGRFEPDTSNSEKEISIIRKAIELGLTHIDTAEIYGKGQAEKEVGEAIKGFDRSKLFITSKVWKDNLSYEGTLNALEGSLQRLGITYLDLYLIHWPNEKIPITETMKALEELQNSGKIKAIGVSNFSKKQMMDAQMALDNSKIVANQIEYNLITRDPEKDIIPYCNENNIMVIAYRPLVKGELFKEKLEILEQLSNKYNKTIGQIALNWLANKDNVITVVKTLNEKHLLENSEYFEISKEDLELLDSINLPKP